MKLRGLPNHGLESCTSYICQHFQGTNTIKIFIGPKSLKSPRQKVLIIDIHEEFGSVENPLIYFPYEECSAHYNELGYKIVAQKVIERLQAN